MFNSAIFSAFLWEENWALNANKAIFKERARGKKVNK